LHRLRALPSPTHRASRRRAVAGALGGVLALNAILVAASPAAAAEGPVLNLQDGQTVSGTVPILAAGTGAVTISAGGAQLEGRLVDYAAVEAKVAFDASSYEGASKQYRFFVNDVEIA